eukprot:3383785-Rhodomonas_salina.1
MHSLSLSLALHPLSHEHFTLESHPLQLPTQSVWFHRRFGPNAQGTTAVLTRGPLLVKSFASRFTSALPVSLLLCGSCSAFALHCPPVLQHLQAAAFLRPLAQSEQLLACPSPRLRSSRHPSAPGCRRTSVSAGQDRLRTKQSERQGGKQEAGMRAGWEKRGQSEGRERTV